MNDSKQSALNLLVLVFDLKITNVSRKYLLNLMKYS